METRTPPSSKTRGQLSSLPASPPPGGLRGSAARSSAGSDAAPRARAEKNGSAGSAHAAKKRRVVGNFDVFMPVSIASNGPGEWKTKDWRKPNAKTQPPQKGARARKSCVTRAPSHWHASAPGDVVLHHHLRPALRVGIH